MGVCIKLEHESKDLGIAKCSGKKERKEVLLPTLAMEPACLSPTQDAPALPAASGREAGLLVLTPGHL